MAKNKYIDLLQNPINLDNPTTEEIVMSEKKNKYIDLLKGTPPETTAKSDLVDLLKKDVGVTAQTSKDIHTFQSPTFSDLGKDVVENVVKPVAGTIFDTGLTTLNQFNKPYSGVMGAAESGIKELTTPSTPEEIQQTPFQNRFLGKIGATLKEAIKGGWNALFSNNKGATDPLKQAVEAVRGPESKMTGDPGILGAAKDLMSAQGLETVRPLTDVTGALAGGDPLMSLKSVLPLSTTAKGLQLVKEEGKLPGTLLEQIAAGNRGFAGYKEGGLVDQLASGINKPIAAGAQKLIDVGESIDNAKPNSWASLLQMPKQGYENLKAGFKDAIFNRTGDPMEDAITEAGLLHGRRQKFIVEETVKPYIKDKESIMLGANAPKTKEELDQLLKQGYIRAEQGTGKTADQIDQIAAPDRTVFDKMAQAEGYDKSPEATLDYVIHALTPEAKVVLEKKTGGALSSGGRSQYKIDPKHASNIARTYVDEAGKDLPLDFVNTVNKFKDEINAGQIPQEVLDKAKTFGLEKEIDPLAKRVSNIYGDFKGEIFDTDPLRAVVTRAIRTAKNQAANEYFDTIRSMADKSGDNRIISIAPNAKVPKGYERFNREELNDIVGTPEIVRRVNVTFDRVHNKGDEQILYDIYNEGMQFWKQSATSGVGLPRVGFTAANITSEFGKGVQQGVTEAQPYMDALQALSMDTGNNLTSPTRGIHAIPGVGKSNTLIDIPGHPGGIHIEGQRVANAVSKTGQHDAQSTLYNAADILNLMKRLGVVDGGFAGQDIGRVLESNPELGSLFVNMTKVVNGEAAPVSKELGAQFVDYFKRNKSLPTIIGDKTFEELPDAVKGVYQQHANGIYKLGDNPQLQNYDYASNLLKENFPNAGKVSSQIEKTVNVGENTNKWKALLDKVKSPLQTAANALDASGHTSLSKIPKAISTFSGIGQDLARWSENTARGANFIDKLKKGYSPKAAAAIVDQTSFNYADRSDLLNKAREIFPFATFAWKNVPLQIEQGLTNQKPFAVTSQLLNAANSEPDTRKDLATAEDFQVNSMPLRIPQALSDLMGATKENNNTYIPIQRHLPMTQVIQRDLTTPKSVVENLISSTGPWKALAEVAMNKNTSSGRPIDTMLTPNDTIFSRENVQTPLGEMGIKYDYLLRNLMPQYGQASRLMGYEKQPKPLMTRIIRDLTGLYPINVDREKNEVSQELRVKNSISQLKNELRKALKDAEDGNPSAKFKAEQIEKLLEDRNFMDSLEKQFK